MFGAAGRHSYHHYIDRIKIFDSIIFHNLILLTNHCRQSVKLTPAYCYYGANDKSDGRRKVC